MIRRERVRARVRRAVCEYGIESTDGGVQCGPRVARRCYGGVAAVAEAMAVLISLLSRYFCTHTPGLDPSAYLIFPSANAARIRISPAYR